VTRNGQKGDQALSFFLCLLFFFSLFSSIAAFSFALASFVLDVLIIDGESFIDLGTKSRIILDAIAR
jgi:hypothetical protein